METRNFAMAPGLIVNADDLGVDAGTTRGIAAAYRNGIVSSASLMVTTAGVEEGVMTARSMDMPVGLHLSFTQGRAVAPGLDRLAGESGFFKLRAGDLIKLRPTDARLVDQIRAEIRAQLSLASDYGLSLTHVDSHQHVHMHPAIFAIVEEEAGRFGIRSIRFSREPLRYIFCGGDYLQVIKRRNLSKWLVTRLYAGRIKARLQKPDLFFGNLYSGVVTKTVLLNVLNKVPLDKSVELCIHPGLPMLPSAVPANNFEAFSASAYRRFEHDALVDKEVIDLVRKRGLTLRSFDGREKRL
jgi:chitin disaccharide deacetylase